MPVDANDSSMGGAGPVDPRPNFTSNAMQVHTLIQGGEVRLHANYAPGSSQHFSVDKPVYIGRIPQLAKARQKRSIEHAVFAVFAEESSEIVCQVIIGMGGVGKTQIAAAYARQRWDSEDLDLLVWANASSRESVIAAFAEASATIGLADLSDSDRAAQKFITWLDKPRGPKWLIILDDLSNPGNLTDLWPPEVGNGRTIVTTRHRNAGLEGDRRALVEVRVFDPLEAEAFMRMRLERNVKAMNGVVELVQDLGYLPLALSQAAAFILDQPGLTCADYRRILADHTVRLVDLSPGLLPDGYPMSAAAAICLSVEAVCSDHPHGLTFGILKILSFLDPAGIPIELFRTQSVKAALVGWKDDENEDDVRNSLPLGWNIGGAIGRLCGLSLIEYEEGVIRIHSLVQRVVRDGLNTDEKELTAKILASALIEMWGSAETDLVQSAMLRSNTTQLHSHARSAVYSSDLQSVFFLANRSLGQVGQVGEAASYAMQLRLECEEFLGPDHIDTLSARNNLAHWMGEVGDASGPVAVYEELLADFIRVLGADHPNILMIRANLARWKGEAGNFSEAAAEFEGIIANALHALHPDHRHIFTMRQNLAFWKGRAGDATGALRVCDSLIEDCVNFFGVNHPETLEARSNRARWLGETGNPSMAIAEFEILLSNYLEMYGGEHPATLLARHNLATWRCESGDVATAIVEFEALIPDCTKILGPDHPDTINARHNLISWKIVTGDLGETLADSEQLLNDEIRVLGSEHPHVFTTRSHLALIHNFMGNPVLSLHMYQELIEDQTAAFGADHPDTLRSRLNFICLYAACGDVPGAKVMIGEFLADSSRIFGPTHPQTSAARENFEEFLQWLEQTRGAVS